MTSAISTEFLSRAVSDEDKLEPLGDDVSPSSSLFSGWEAPGPMDNEALKKLYETNSTARVFLDHVARRKNNLSVMRVDRTIDLLKDVVGHEISRKDIINVFKGLQKVGCGQFVPGRRGRQSRFYWQTEMTTVGKAAAGEPISIESIMDEEGTSSEIILTHKYHLRADLLVQFDLPQDLTKSEADRLAAFVQTLPFDPESEE